MKPNDELVVVYETQGMRRAEIIKAQLESAGIPAMLKYESVGRTMGIIVDGVGKVQVLVRVAPHIIVDDLTRHPMNRTAIRHETRFAGFILHNSRRF